MIIFLDIDGVLRPTNSWVGRDEFGQLFINDCVESLRYLINKTNGKIVISSTWKSSGLSIMKEMWEKRELPGEVIDITPNEVDVVDNGGALFYDMVDRGMEINQWIVDNNYSGSYIIIDDIPDFTDEQTLNYIRTNPKIGLTINDVDNFLNKI